MRDASRLASVGWATAFGCTVVSTIALVKAAGLAASARIADARLADSSAFSLQEEYAHALW